MSAAYINQRTSSAELPHSKMAAASLDRGMQDNLTKLRLQMLGEKLQRERQSSRSILSSSSSEDDHPADQAQVRLHRAMLKRDDLLERLRKDHRYDPSIRPISRQPTPPRVVQPPRPPSLPEMKPVYQPIQPVQQILPPIQPIQQPAPQQPIYQVMQPPNVANNNFGKGDFMEMMMMQNAQMHQMVMNQLMMSSLPNNAQSQRGPQIIRLDEGGGQSQPIIVGGGGGNNNPRIINTGGNPGAGGASPRGVVHHHHYSNPPVAPSPMPMVSNITHLPPLDFRARQVPPPPPPQVQVFPREVEPLKQPKDYYASYYQQQPYPYEQHTQQYDPTQYYSQYAQYQTNNNPQQSYNPYTLY